MGFGARPYGMGGAFVALSDDVNASYWNPAGLDQLEQKEFGFMYAKPYLGLEGVDWGLLYLTYAHPVKQNKIGVFGFNVTSFNIEDLYREYSISLSYAWTVIRNVRAGVNLKYLYHLYNWDEETKSLDNPVVNAEDSKGKFSLDIGTLIKPEGRRFGFGVCLKNINQPDVGLYYEDKVPMEIRAGMLYNFGDIKSFEDVVVTFDTSYINQDWAEDMNFYLGGETWLKYHTFGLRSGFNFTQSDLNELTFGFSYNKPVGNFILLIDYSVAWSMNIKDNIGTHRISTGVRF